MFFFWFLYVILYIPLRIFFPVKSVNKKNAIKKGRVIYAPNHQSILDPLYMINSLQRHQYFVCKKEVGKFFLFRWFLKAVGVIFVDRNKPSRSFYRDVNNILNKNKALTIFPEGTRKNAEIGSELELKNGIAMFALKTNSPIVPVTLVEKPRFLRRVHVVYGEPFYLPKVERINKETLEEAANIVSVKMQEVGLNYKKELELKAKTKAEKKLARKK